MAGAARESRPTSSTSATMALPGEPALERPTGVSVARPASEASGAAASAGLIYLVQAGAFARSDDAEQQRAKLAMMGMEAKLSEREQSGHTVYRVRVGPFEKKADADAAKDALTDAGIEAALVRAPR